MTQRPITPAQVTAYVRALADRPDGRVIALKGPPQWDGPDVVHVNSRPVRIAACGSALAVREALATHANGGDRLVVLTDRTEQDLGDDVVGRLARQRVILPDSWDMLASAFGASTIDPRLRPHCWLADALLESTSSAERPVVPGRALSLEFARDALLERLGLPTPVSLEGLLAWSMEPANVHGYTAVSAPVRDGVEGMLADALGPVAGHVLAMVREGTGEQAVPVGLVCRVLFPEVASAESGKALGGMEQGYLRGGPLSAVVAREWADASEAIVRRLLAQAAPTAEAALDRAEQVLANLGGQGLAGASDVLRAGLERRLEAFADAFGDPDAREAALAAVERHVLAEGVARRRVEAARMAARLARRPQGDADWGVAFADACRWYQDEGGWIDRARAALWGQDPNPRVAAVYAEVTREFDALRDAVNIRFAQSLQNWLQQAGPDDALVPIESIIDGTLAPLAAAGPVMLLVMDGMSMAVFRELTADLVRESFREITPHAVAHRRPAVSVVPSVTEVCRTSLLSGYLTGGDQGRERRRFEAHPALLGVSTSGAPPRMFHKAELVKEDGRSLAAGVEDVVANPGQRVVGAVLNVVDDQLMKGDQLGLEFSPGTIPLLQRLLTAARQAGRVVVLASDHGHVFERGLEQRPSFGGGERWRNGDDPAPDEVLLRGERVLLGDGRVIAAATERVRYAAKRNGYHGGATPQEMVVPLSVWASVIQHVPGWEELLDAPPAWWGPPPLATPLPPVPTPAPAKARAPEGQASLFEQPDAPPAPEKTGGDWIDRLIASPVFADQAAQAGRFGLDEQTLRPVLSTLEARGGRAPLAVVAQAAGVAPVRASGLVTKAQRVLNVDGYAIVSLDPVSDEVVLNRDQLLAQFGL